VLDIFEVGSQEVFSWAGLEPWSSWSPPPGVAKITGLNHQHLTCGFLVFKKYLNCH
jgi:hypothetical protein